MTKNVLAGLNRWFALRLLRRRQRFFGLSHTLPTTAPSLNAVERDRARPLFRQIACGTNLVLYRRARRRFARGGGSASRVHGVLQLPRPRAAHAKLT